MSCFAAITYTDRGMSKNEKVSLTALDGDREMLKHQLFTSLIEGGGEWKQFAARLAPRKGHLSVAATQPPADDATPPASRE